MRLALLQCAPFDDVTAATARLEAVAAEAAAKGAEILIAPEMYLTGYDIGVAAVRAAAEPIDGAMVAAVAEIARKNEIAIVAGFPLRDDGRIFNAVAFIDRSGERRSLYRKTHLYGDVDQSQFSAGDRLADVFDYEGWKIGLAICYDIEFPEVARALTLAGAELLLVPTANMEPFDTVARRLVPARAEENGVAIAYANYCGAEGRFRYCGQSCVADALGNDLARAGNDETLLIADVDRNAVLSARNRTPYLADRRPSLYGNLT